MKINDVSRLGAIQQYRNSGKSESNQPGKKAMQRDELQISSKAKELLGQEQNRVERIQELKQSVENGTNHVDAHKIAEKLLLYFRN